MTYLDDRYKAESYIKRATHLSSLGMLNGDLMPEIIDRYKILIQNLENENENVQFMFALMVQERTDMAVEIYNRMGKKAEDMMVEMLPANMTMTLLCYETTDKILGKWSSNRTRFLKEEFNNLPKDDSENPRHVFHIYKQAFSK